MALTSGRSASKDVRRDDGSDALSAVRLLLARFSRVGLWGLAPLTGNTLLSSDHITLIAIELVRSR